MTDLGLGRGATTRSTAELAPITADDLDDVADFLRANLNDGVAWRETCASVPWQGQWPNYGFQLRDGDRVVGALLALYSTRMVAGRVEKFCNMGSWCVRPEYRSRSLSLLKALLAQDDYHFTVLTADVGPQEILAWSGFRPIDTTAALIPNLPWPSAFGARGLGRTRVSCAPADLETTLAGTALRIYRDHAGALAARHVVLARGQRTCYVMYRESRFRGRPVALLLYVSDPELFGRTWRTFTAHLLLRHRLLATVAELRIIGAAPLASVSIRNWPRMFRSSTLEAEHIDYLYSELTCVPW